MQGFPRIRDNLATFDPGAIRPRIEENKVSPENCIMKFSIPRLALAAAASVALLGAPAAFAFDADAAKSLAKENDCFKCHAIDKTKKGPSYKKIAAKYQGKEAEGFEKIKKNITTGPKVKLEDGTEEDHKIINTKDEGQLKNLMQWILAQ